MIIYCVWETKKIFFMFINNNLESSNKSYEYYWLWIIRFKFVIFEYVFILKASTVINIFLWLVDGEDMVRVARGCVYNKAELCKSMQRLDDEFKTLRYCNSCDDDKCNGASSLNSSVVAIILTAVATCLFYRTH